MKHFLLIVSAVLIPLIGCAPSPPESTAPQMEIVSMTGLPTLPERFPAKDLRLNTLFRVLNDGSVAEARFLNSSGDVAWDKAAIDSIMEWHFTPLNQPDATNGRWIRNVIIVQVQEPTVITLGQLTSANRQEADSVYSLLEHGADFDALLKKARPDSPEATGVYFGTVNIAIFPPQVRVVLQKLGIDKYTEPIRVGTKYCIYKRYAGDGSRFLPD